MMTTPVFLRHFQPSQAADVTRLSRVSVGRAYTVFRSDQVNGPFPSRCRFPLTHLHTGSYSRMHGLKYVV